MSGMTEFEPRVHDGESFGDRDAYHAAVAVVQERRRAARRLEELAVRAGELVAPVGAEDPLWGHSPSID